MKRRKEDILLKYVTKYVTTNTTYYNYFQTIYYYTREEAMRRTCKNRVDEKMTKLRLNKNREREKTHYHRQIQALSLTTHTIPKTHLHSFLRKLPPKIKRSQAETKEKRKRLVDFSL